MRVDLMKPFRNHACFEEEEQLTGQGSLGLDA